MNGWIKYFTDNSSIIGTDQDVLYKRASWSKSRLTDIVKVELIHNNTLLQINGLGEYWQSDSYVSGFTDFTPTLVSRRIEKKIVRPDTFITFKETENKYIINVYSNSELPQCDWTQILAITTDLYNRWLVLEYTIKNNKVKFYFSGNKI